MLNKSTEKKIIRTYTVSPKLYEDVVKCAEEIFLGKFKSSKKLILEEFLEGEEASYFLIVDKKSYSFKKYLCKIKIIKYQLLYECF